MVQCYLFGGEGGEGQLLGDLWRFDMQAMEWQQLWDSATLQAEGTEGCKCPPLPLPDPQVS